VTNRRKRRRPHELNRPNKIKYSLTIVRHESFKCRLYLADFVGTSAGSHARVSILVALLRMKVRTVFKRLQTTTYPHIGNVALTTQFVMSSTAKVRLKQRRVRYRELQQYYGKLVATRIIWRIDLRLRIGGRGRRAHLTAGPWPAGDSRPRSRRGPGVKSFTPDPSGPSRPDLVAIVMITAQGSMRGGAGRIGTRSGLDAGGAAPHNARLPLPAATTAQPQTCVAPAARRARGA
jgi:hypothetical protein